MNPKTSGNPFQEVLELNRSARQLVIQLINPAIAAVRGKLLNRLKGADHARATELIELIQRDAEEFKNKITEIERKHSAWPDAPKRPNHFQAALSVGGEYVALIDNIQTVLSQSSVELCELLDKPLAVRSVPDQPAAQ